MEDDYIDAFVQVSLAAAGLLGFYGMANSYRHSPSEIIAFGLSLLCGLFLGLGLVRFFGDHFQEGLLWICMLWAGIASLLVALPRFIYQCMYAARLPLGFYFRLSTYAAVLIAISLQYADSNELVTLVSMQTWSTLGFYASWGICQTRVFWKIAWFSFPLQIYSTTIGYIILRNMPNLD